MNLAKAGLAVFFLLGAPARASNFDDFLPGAKAMGMGMAYSAVADDPYAMFFNPAGTANAPYAQAGTSLGRMSSPVGTMSFGALTYLRPYERINTATVGAAYYAGRQANGGDKDVFLFHYAQEVKVPQLFLTKPLKVGGNFKFLNVEHNGAGFGMGFDGGVLARSNFGLTGSFTMADLVTNVGQPRPKIGLGLAYTWQKWLTAAGDLKVRSNLTEFYPGLEAAFLQGLLKVRIGRGFQLDGVSQMALGLGVNFSPVVLDVAMTVPTNGINRQGGSYQASFNYRFGAPSFAGNFVGQAASQAETLRTAITDLQEKKKTLEVQTQTADTHREIAEGELSVLQQRIRELQDQYREMQKRKEEADYVVQEAELRQQTQGAKPAALPMVRKTVPKAPARWPRTHVVKYGETLRSLAREYYGDANLWEQIYRANKDKVERGLPQEGAEFTIPKP